MKTLAVALVFIAYFAFVLSCMYGVYVIVIQQHHSAWWVLLMLIPICMKPEYKGNL